MRIRVAWSLFALTVVTAVLHIVVLVAGSRPLLSAEVMAEGFPLVTIGGVGGAFVGALIISRYPGHPIGWLFLVGQLLSELGVALGDYGHSTVTGELGAAPAGHLAIWFSVQTGGLFVVALLGVLFLLAPDGHLASSRWTYALALTVAGISLRTLAVMTVSPDELDPTGQLQRSPGPVLTATLIASSMAVLVGVTAGVVSMCLRLRRSTGVERQQLQLVVLGALALAVGMAINTLATLLDAPAWLRDQPLMAAYACLPVLTAVAILRYRLYDIDIFLNRALTLTILTGLVTLGYVTVVVLIGTALPFARDRFWPSLLATALVALAVQPARGWADRLAARLVYGRRAAPYVELAEFSKGLQDAPGTDELLRRVAESVVRAVGARRATITLDVPGRPTSEVEWPQQTPRGLGDTTTVPVADETGLLGRLSVTMPRHTSLEPDEQRLLEDFAVQLAQAFGNMRLESALAHQVQLLRTRTADLEASGRRLALAQDRERRRFEEALTRTVVPHLQLVRDGVFNLLARDDLDAGRAARSSATDLLGDLSAETRTALEALRDLTRGVFPTQLERRGLVAALRAHLATTGAAEVRAPETWPSDLDPTIESATYFCVVDFLRELEGPGSVAIGTSPDLLTVEVTGPLPVPPPRRVDHLHDRAAALDGSLSVTEVDGATRLVLHLPLSSPPHEGPDTSEAVGVKVDLGDVGARAAP